MSAGCDMVDVAAREFLEGARDLESFAKAMKRRFGRDLKPDVINAAFNKAADRFAAMNAPLDTIKLELAKELAATRQSGLLETITALRRAGLISGVRTQVRNIVGNTGSAAFDAVSRVPGALADMVMAKFTGNRTVLLGNAEAAKAAIKNAVTNGIKDWGAVIKTGATPQDLARYDIPRELNAYFKGVELKPLNAYVNYINRFQAGADKPFREYAFTRSLVEQAQLAARTNKIPESQVKGYIEATVKSPSEPMLLQAIADAEEAVFSNRSQITDMFGKVQSPGGKFALDTLVPFKRVPSNISGRVLESTPLGSIKIASLIRQGIKDPAVQRELAKTFGRSATGSSLIYLGYALAENNLATGNYPQRNRGLADRMEATGQKPSSIMINGEQIKIGDSPAGMLIAIGASMQRDSVEGSNPLGTVMSGAKNIGAQVLELPMVEGVKSLVDTVTDPASSGDRFATSLAGSLIPTWSADMAQLVDPGKVRKPSNALEAIKARIPGLRESVPLKRDAFGNTIEPDSLWNILAGGQLRTDPVSNALRQYRVNIQKPNKVKDPKDPRSKETDEQYWNRVKLSGEQVYLALDALIQSDGFRKLTPEEKKEAMSNTIRQARQDFTRQEKARS